jgi:S1-C subfamily serine protease
MGLVIHSAIDRLQYRMREKLGFRAILVFALAAATVARVQGEACAFAPGSTPIAEGVVRVVNRLGNECSIGSGTLVDRQADMGIVLTCAHVFSDGVGELTVFFDGATPRHALVIAIDKKNDLASLVVKHPPAAAVPLATAVPAPGSPLASCGFGPQGTFRVNRGQYLGPVTLEDGEDLGVLEIEGAARQGDSGGPIFDERHQLVAVIFGSNGEVVDGTHCGVIREFLAAYSVSNDLARRITHLASRPIGESNLLFRGEIADASEVQGRPLALVTVRGVVRHGDQAASGAKLHITGSTTRVATLDQEGRFAVQVVAGGSYELTVDAVVHNRVRHGQSSIWVSEAMPREIELKLE